MEHTPAEKPHRHKVNVPSSARKGPEPKNRFEVKRSTFFFFFFFFPFLKWLRWRRPRPPRVSGLLPGTRRGVRGAGGGKDFELRNRSRRNAFNHLRRFSVPNHTISSMVFRGPCCLVCFRDPPSLTSHRLRSREPDLGYKIRTRCVQKKKKKKKPHQTPISFLPVVWSPCFLPLVPVFGTTPKEWWPTRVCPGSATDRSDLK